MSNLKTAIEKYGEREAEDFEYCYINDDIFKGVADASSFEKGFRAALELLWPCVAALKNAKGPHSINGQLFDDATSIECADAIIDQALAELEGKVK